MPDTSADHSDDNALRDQKRNLRPAMIAVRKRAHDANPQAAAQLRDRVLAAHYPLPAQSMIAAYMAQGEEMNPAPLVEALLAQGHHLCLPVITGKNVPLIFRQHRPGAALVPGVWQIPEPALSAPLVTPDILLVPLLAFDRRGYRLGYGGGYYDRTLAQLRQQHPVFAIGLGFAGQEIPQVPVGAHDAKLDAVLTENEFFLAG